MRVRGIYFIPYFVFYLRSNKERERERAEELSRSQYETKFQLFTDVKYFYLADLCTVNFIRHRLLNNEINPARNYREKVKRTILYLN